MEQMLMIGIKLGTKIVKWIKGYGQNGSCFG
jgi:hypothetical protein